jgi:hypothetical protein
MKKLHISLFLFLACSIACNAQQKIAEITAPAGFSDNNDAAGYYNKYNQRFILCQQKDDTLYRLMYDTAFHLISKYNCYNKEVTYRLKKKQKRQSFVTDLAADNYHYEVYQQGNRLFVYRLNFEAGTDQLAATIVINSSLPDESMLAIMTSGKQLRYMTHSRKENTLLLYTFNPADNTTAKTLFRMPKTNLTDAEIKQYNSEVKLNLAKSMSDFAVQRSDQPNVTSVPSDNRIFYDDNQVFLLLKMPYNLGYYVMQVLFKEGTMTGHNLFINSLQEDYYCGDMEKKKALSVAVTDSVLIVANNNAVNLQLYFFNATTLRTLKSYNVNVTDSIHTIIHSKLKQKGTWGSQKEIKELSNAELYYRRKSAGSHYLSVSALTKEAIVLTSGSFVETGGALSTFLSLGSIGLGVFNMAITNGANLFVPDMFGFVYGGKGKFKYLYTHSKFLKSNFEPVGQTNITSFLDIINEQITGEKFSKPGSFFIQQNETYYTGLFNKQSGYFELLKFAY